jgi:hypothetical protein
MTKETDHRKGGFIFGSYEIILAGISKLSKVAFMSSYHLFSNSTKQKYS